MYAHAHTHTHTHTHTHCQECQAVRGELQRALGEKESLNLKVQEYTQSLLRAEEAIAVKEQEKAELMESYRSLSEEADKLDSTVQLSMGENSATKLELSTLMQVELLDYKRCWLILSVTLIGEAAP